MLLHSEGRRTLCLQHSLDNRCGSAFFIFPFSPKSSKSAALHPNSGHVHLLTAFLKQIACKAADRRPEAPVLQIWRSEQLSQAAWCSKPLSRAHLLKSKHSSYCISLRVLPNVLLSWQTFQTDGSIYSLFAKADEHEQNRERQQGTDDYYL